MSGLIYDLFKLIPMKSSDLIPDHIYKNSRFSKAVIEKSIRFLLRDKFSGDAFDLLLILLPLV